VGDGISAERQQFAPVSERNVGMQVRSSLKSLKKKDGSVVVRRRGRTFIVNKLHPRWKARQG
jgi:large subunit ribosomal protein L36